MNYLRDNTTTEYRDFLWKLYTETRSDLRSLRSERATASNMILVTSLGVIGLVAHHGLPFGDWPLTAGLVFVGLFGTVFMANHFQCIKRCKDRACYFLKCLNKAQGVEETSKTDKPTKECPSDWEDGEFPNFRDLETFEKFRVLWPLAIALMGAAATHFIFARALTHLVLARLNN